MHSLRRRLMLSAAIVAIMGLSYNAQAQSYFDSSEALQQVDKGEFLFSYIYDWDRFHMKFRDSAGVGTIKSTTTLHTAQFEWGLNNQYSWGVLAEYIDNSTEMFLKPPGFTIKRPNEGFQSLGMFWKFQKKWQDALFHIKGTVLIPPGDQREKNEKVSNVLKETTGARIDKRFNLLVGYATQAWFVYWLGFTAEATLFQVPGREEEFDTNDVLTENWYVTGEKLRQFKFFIEYPDVDQLFGANIVYTLVTDGHYRDLLNNDLDVYPGEKSIGAEVYYRRPFLWKTELMAGLDYRFWLLNGDKDEIELENRSGSGYGGTLKLRKYF